MSSVAIVKHFDVLNDISPGLLSGRIVCKKDSLSLQATEKVLCPGIVPTIPFPGHAANHPKGLQH